MRVDLIHLLNIVFSMYKKSNKQLTSIADVILAMKKELPGGRKMDVAQLLGISPCMVSDILKQERIPRPHHHIISRFLEARGYWIDEDEVFGYSTRSLLEKTYGHPAAEYRPRTD